MPHSVSPEASPAAEDSVLPDAPPEPISEPDQDLSSSHGDTPTPSNGNAVDGSVKPVPKEDIKLEDLFDDDEEDEEFPSSSAPDVKMESSPPQEPMYGFALS